MPLYEYECGKCGHRFEVIRKFSDPPVEECPVCGGGVRKLQSAPAFQFKGSGWYVTDYAKKPDAPSVKTEGGSSTAAPAKSDKSDKSGAAPAGESASKSTPAPASGSSSKDS